MTTSHNLGVNQFHSNIKYRVHIKWDIFISDISGKVSSINNIAWYLLPYDRFGRSHQPLWLNRTIMHYTTALRSFSITLLSLFVRPQVFTQVILEKVMIIPTRSSHKHMHRCRIKDRWKTCFMLLEESSSLAFLIIIF